MAELPPPPDPPSAEDIAVVHDETAGIQGTDENADALLVDDVEAALLLAADSLDPIGQVSSPLNITEGDSSITDVSFDVASLDLAGNTTTDGQPLMVLFSSDDLVIIGTAGGDPVLSFHLVDTGTDGIPDSFVAIQYESMLHEDSPDNFDEGLTNPITIDYSVSDGTSSFSKVVDDTGGNTTTATITVDIEDDGPTADIQLTGTMAITDESVGADPGDPNADDEVGHAVTLVADAGTVLIGFDQEILVDVSNSDPGEDDEGATTEIDLALVIGNPAGDDSGLDTTDGDNILLFDEGGVIVGRSDADGQAIFAISIDDGGQATVEQYESIFHGDSPNNFDEPAVLGNGLIEAVVTVTDGNGDIDTASVDLGGQVKFEDDGPAAAIELTENMAITDESTREVGTDPNFDDESGAVAIIGLAALIGFGQATLVDASASETGEDEEGATTSITLSLVGGNGSNSTLDTTDGTDILLFDEGGVIVGRAGGGGGDPIFAIAIDDTGLVTVEQYDSILQGDSPTNFDEQAVLGDGLVEAVVTVTDGDLDQETASVDLGGQIKFEDDGPKLGPVPDSTNALPFASGTMEMKNFEFSVGEDDENATGLQITDFIDPDDPADSALFTSSGLEALQDLIGDIDAALSGDGKTVTYSTADGELFKLTVDDSGKWTFDISQDGPTTFNFLDFSAFKNGPPQDTLTPLSQTSTTAVFDGILFTNNNTNDFHINLDDPLDSALSGDGQHTGSEIDDRPDVGVNAQFEKQDNLNVNQVGVGVFSGPSSNFGELTGMKVNFSNPNPAFSGVEGMGFEIRTPGQGQWDGMQLTLLAIDSMGNVEEHTIDLTDELQALKGNEKFIFTVATDDVALSPTVTLTQIDSVEEIWFKFTMTDDSDALRVRDIFLIEQGEVPDVNLAFEVQGQDGDLDQTQTEEFSIFIDGDGDGVA